jgi:hypothetical protein
LLFFPGSLLFYVFSFYCVWFRNFSSFLHVFPSVFLCCYVSCWPVSWPLLLDFQQKLSTEVSGYTGLYPLYGADEVSA